MAKIQSSEIFSHTTVDDLKVIPYFKELMEACVSDKSIYMTAKNTLLAMFEDGSLNREDRDKLLSVTFTNVITTLTDKSMTIALEMAKENLWNGYKLSKLKADTIIAQEQADLLSAQNTHIPIQISLDTARLRLEEEKLLTEKARIEVEKAKQKFMVIEGWKVQAQMIREDGFNRNNIPAITQVTLPSNTVLEAGMKYEQQQQSKLSSYAVMAKAYRESGVVHWTQNSSGHIYTITDFTPSASGLTKAQEKVAKRQLIGFDDNKLQHVVNSSANMIGLILTAEAEDGALTSADVDLWRQGIRKMLVATPTIT